MDFSTKGEKLHRERRKEKDSTRFLKDSSHRGRSYIGREGRKKITQESSEISHQRGRRKKEGERKVKTQDQVLR